MASVFSLPANCVYYEVKRLRYINDSPMSIHIASIPDFLVPGLETKRDDMETQQPFMIPEKSYGMVGGTVRETWNAVRAPRWVTETLEPGQPTLMETNVTHGTDRQVHLSKTEYFHGDKISHYFEFQ